MNIPAHLKLSGILPKVSVKTLNYRCPRSRLNAEPILHKVKRYPFFCRRRRITSSVAVLQVAICQKRKPKQNPSDLAIVPPKKKILESWVRIGEEKRRIDSGEK